MSQMIVSILDLGLLRLPKIKVLQQHFFKLKFKLASGFWCYVKTFLGTFSKTLDTIIYVSRTQKALWDYKNSPQVS